MSKRTLALMLALCAGCAGEIGELEDEVAPAIDNGEMELAFPGRDGLLRRGMLAPSSTQRVPVSYVEYDGVRVLEGDIVLDDDLLAPMEAAPSSEVAFDPRLIVTANPDRLWPNAVVPYAISSSLPNKQRVRDAIAIYEANTPLRFRLRNDEDNYVRFVPGEGCSSVIGRIGGLQRVTLGENCPVAAVLHEIGHAIGLFHEQSRLDRDDYIRIQWDNIIEEYKDQFYKYTTSGFDAEHLGGYGLTSVMHYSSTAFSKNGKRTIVRKDGNNGGTIPYHAPRLSQHDIVNIAKLYD